GRYGVQCREAREYGANHDRGGIQWAKFVRQRRVPCSRTTNRQAEVMLCDVELVAVRRESPALLLQICRERGARRVSGRKPAECRHEMVDVGCADFGLGTSRLACAAACRERDERERDGLHACYPSPSTNPRRQLANAGCHARSRFALPLEPPRVSVIMDSPPSPSMSAPSQAGRRRGALAPTAFASAGSQTLTGAGSSSTTL